MIKYLNQQNVKALLKQDPSVKTISAEAMQWIDDTLEQLVKTLAATGRKSPGGRLMGPRSPEAKAAALGAQYVAPRAEPSVEEVARSEETWSEYNDWQAAVRAGSTRLPFKEWTATPRVRAALAAARSTTCTTTRSKSRAAGPTRARTATSAARPGATATS